LLCALICCPAAERAFAAEDAATTSDDSLDEVVVVANRAPEPLSRVGNSVTVLTGSDIQASQLPMVADLLAQTPGVSIARSGGIGQPTSVFIRGADSDQTVVIIDGVQINDPSSTAGGFDFQNLLASNLSRIEILRGAQSTLYGSQAMGGVIDITTAQPTSRFGGGVTAEGGSHDTGSISGNVGGNGDSLLWQLSGNWYGTSGIPAFDERFGGTRLCASQIGGGSGRLRYDITPDLDVDVRGYYVQSRTDFDGYDTPNFTFGNDNEYGRNDQVLAYAGLTLRSPDRSLSNRIAYQYTYTDTRDYDPDAPFDGYGVSSSTETYYGVGRNEREEYQGTWEMTPGYQWVFGAQHERSTIDTDSPAFDFTPMPVENYASIDSGFAQLHGEVVPGLALTAGERYDRHDVYGGHTTGAFAAAWALNDGRTLLRSSFSQGFKAPSLYQLYSNYGNLALRPEAGETWDAGVEQYAWERRLTLSATYFERHSRDLIEFYDCPSLASCLNPSGGYYANLSRAEAHGVELQGAYDPTGQVTLAANYTLTQTEDQSPGSPTYGEELLRRPKNAANASLTYRAASRLSTNVAVRYAGASFDTGPVGGEVRLGGYVLVDLRASYELLDRLEIYARVENATGKHYETEYEYGTLGRVAYAGVRASF
jgi:vitamin B12 transporter